MKNNVPDSIIVWAIRSISGEITENMRMIAFSYDGGKAKFRFYMSAEPSEDEREIGEIIAINFDSGLPERLDTLDIEFVVTNGPLGRLDILDFSLFRRWEAV